MFVQSISPWPNFDPKIDQEGYCQELLYAWIKRYFSAVPFSHHDQDDVLREMTWPKCEFGFEETTMPIDQLKAPMIHLYHPTGPVEWRCCGMQSEHRMMAEVLVPSVISDMSHFPSGNASHWVRFVADRLHYLMRSNERGALASGGITRLEPATRPVVQPAMAGLYRRSFVFTFQFCAP